MPQPPVFKDHFSARAGDYRQYRPVYPRELYSWLAAVAPGRRLALDVATGNGQAATGLAEYFDTVIATDASRAQLRQARTHPRVEYRVEPAEAMSLPDAGADLVVAAQAAHWFEWDAFIAEARRVLRPGGVLAIWAYARFEVEPAIDRLVEEFSRDVVGPGWPRERRHVDDGYRELSMPFGALEAPRFEMRVDWDVDALLGYLSTWSAVRRMRARTHRDPLALVRGPLAAAWGGGLRRVAWPLALKAGRSSATTGRVAEPAREVTAL